MRYFLGIDTSNYTTSVALFDSHSGSAEHRRKLLPVKQGERGLRQSDAVFHHTVQLPEITEELLCGEAPDCVGVSYAPTSEKGSYMPCFLTGLGTARALGAALSIPVYRFSHQEGHIAAALYSIGKLDMFRSPFLAFHISGGTTQLVRVTPSDDEVLEVLPVSGTLDLNAGQAVDRLGVKLGYSFPAGKAIDALSLNSEKEYFEHSKIKLIGGSCSLSGLENQCDKMLASGEEPCDTAKFLLDSIARALYLVTADARKREGDLPIVYMGGVMSNTVIRKTLSRIPDSFFASAELSSDNAVGVSVLAYLKSSKDSL